MVLLFDPAANFVGVVFSPCIGFQIATMISLFFQAINRLLLFANSVSFPLKTAVQLLLPFATTLAAGTLPCFVQESVKFGELISGHDGPVNGLLNALDFFFGALRIIFDCADCVLGFAAIVTKVVIPQLLTP